MKAITDLVPDPGGSVELSVDEGGLRCEWGSRRHAYIPLDAIADVSVHETLFGGVRLVLTGVSKEDEVRLDVANASCVAIQRLLLVALDEQRRAHAERNAPSPPALARDERSIEAWLGDVARHATGSYRDAAFDHAVLAAVLADVHGDVEARAAAAYALLASGDEEHLVAVTRVFIMHALPPIVLAAAHAAPGGPALVPIDVVTEIKPYLSKEDVTGLAAMRATSRNEEHEDRVRSALEQAKVLAAADARREQEEAAAQAPKWRRLHTAASGTDTRWVGKTWAL